MNSPESPQAKPEPLLRFPALKPYTGGVSRVTIYEWIRKGAFPAPLKLGGTGEGCGRAIAWRESDIKKWQDASQSVGAEQ